MAQAKGCHCVHSYLAPSLTMWVKGQSAPSARLQISRIWEGWLTCQRVVLPPRGTSTGQKNAPPGTSWSTRVASAKSPLHTAERKAGHVQRQRAQKDDLSEQFLSSSPCGPWPDISDTLSKLYWDQTLVLFWCMEATFCVLPKVIKQAVVWREETEEVSKAELYLRFLWR